MLDLASTVVLDYESHGTTTIFCFTTLGVVQDKEKSPILMCMYLHVYTYVCVLNLLNAHAI
jgi:hypothetical protein